MASYCPLDIEGLQNVCSDCPDLFIRKIKASSILLHFLAFEVPVAFVFRTYLIPYQVGSPLRIYYYACVVVMFSKAGHISSGLL